MTLSSGTRLLLVAAAAVVACSGATSGGDTTNAAGAPSPDATGSTATPGVAADGGSAPPASSSPDGGAPAYDPVVDLGPRAGRTVFAMSDIHGGYDRMATLLAAAGVIAPSPKSPEAMAWSAADGVLVVVGDLIDKGPQPLEVIAGLRALEASAAAAGGHVVVLLGNHEAELFADPNNAKATAADGIDVELAAQGIDPVKFAAGDDPRGAWLRDRPVGLRIGTAFFSHAGYTAGATLDQLRQTFLAARTRGFGDPVYIGTTSLLEARDWYTSATVVTGAASALGVTHIVFGHDPNALGARGSIATSFGDALTRIDCGMSPDVNDSTGCILRIRDKSGSEVADAVVASGATHPVWAP